MTSGERVFQLAAAGDAMIARRISTFENPRFQPLVDSIQEADASIINLEVLLHDYESPPAANGPGTYMRAPRWVADELSLIGFDMFAAATNHSIDYGPGGMVSTMRALEEREIPYAGLGRTLTEARSPSYIDTASGRVGLVAACATVTTGSSAGESSRGMKGRPGISPLGHDSVYRVPSDAYAQLKKISKLLGLEDYKDHLAALGFPIAETDTGFRLVTLGGDTHPVVEEATEYEVERIPHEEDVTAIVRQVQEARRQADWVVASLHYHEGRGAGGTDQTVPQFVETFARDCIDAGADAFLGHGSHCLRGIEIYDDTPIFYSLGNFVAQNDLVERLPQEMYDRADLGPDATPADVFGARATAADGSKRGFAEFREYYETILPVCSFGSDGLENVTLYPVDLGRDRKRPARGQPSLASDPVATEILCQVDTLSEPYGTDVTIQEESATLEW